MRIQSSGESNVIFKTKENVIMPETPEHAGFVVKRFEDAVFFTETEMVLCKVQSLKRREIWRVGNHPPI